MEGSVEKVISDALARRPDILAAYAAQKASLAGVRAAEAEFLPKVFVAGTGSYNGETLSVAGIPSIGKPVLGSESFGQSLWRHRIRRRHGPGFRRGNPRRDLGASPSQIGQRWLGTLSDAR
jgi:Outer membrane efflux protein